jgi:hypothetical protein
MPSGPFCTTEISLAALEGPVSHASANASPEIWRSDRGKVVATGANLTFVTLAFTYDVEKKDGKHVGKVFYKPDAITQEQRDRLRDLAIARAQLSIKVNFNNINLGDLVLNLKP